MLHGKIEINDYTVVEYRAVCMENLYDDVHRYECFVRHTSNAGYTYNYEFDVEHSRSKGAMQLVVFILDEADIRRLRDEHRRG